MENGKKKNIPVVKLAAKGWDENPASELEGTTVYYKAQKHNQVVCR